MTGHYDLPLVLLSLLIAVIASYAALDLAGRVTTAPTGRGRGAWFCGGSIVMGLGIWAMHYVGMAAFKLPVPVLYDWPTVLVSLLAAIVSSSVALFVASQTFMTRSRAILGSLVMGSGIAAMHYIGMDAMRLPAICEYSPRLVTFSITIAVLMSYAALRLAFAMRGQPDVLGWPKAGGALLLGLAVASMHYVGMASATFVPHALAMGRLGHAVRASDLGLTTIVVATLVFLLFALVASAIDRQATLRAKELIRSRQQLASVFDAMNEAIVIQDGDRNIVRLNRAASRLLGMPANPFSHQAAEATFDLLSLDGTPIALENWPIARAVRGEFCQNTELVIQNKQTGARFFAELSTAPIANMAGDGRQIMSTIRDITERKLMDMERTLVAAIVESSEDAIVGEDLVGCITSWNPGAEKLFGFTAAEMMGQSVRRVIPADLAGEVDEFLAKVARDEVVDRVETVRQRKDGSLINVSVTISPIRNQWGQIVGASKIVRDITDRVKMERQTALSQKMDAVGQLVGGISHDFNNLLGVIIGNLDLLERLIPGHEAAMKRLKTARKAADRGADLTRRLLSFSRTDELQPATTDLQHSIRNVLDLAGRGLGPTIKIAMEFDPLAKSVFVDASSFETALLNLAVNARDSMPKGGTLTITTQRTKLDESFPSVKAGEMPAGAYVCVCVSDTGAGMSRAVMDRAFEPFYTTKPLGGGTGLGLAMVYGFARQSGGTVRIYSEVGVGTTVSIYLPVTTSEVAFEQVPGSTQTYAKSGGTVLVVDDEKDLLEIAVAYLTELGYDALEAHDAESALRVLGRRDDVVLVITDIIMPGGTNGVELAQLAHQLNPNLKIIYTSGFPAGALQEKSMAMIDGPLLRKPYRISDFITTVSNVMKPAE